MSILLLVIAALIPIYLVVGGTNAIIVLAGALLIGAPSLMQAALPERRDGAGKRAWPERPDPV